MNPTDEVDDLLARAGARWRADQPSPPDPDLDHILRAGRRPRRWIPALAAASVAAIAAGALAVLPHGGSAPPAGQTIAQGNQAPNENLLVRNGDQVEADGQVILLPGQDPVFCAPLPRPATELPGKAPMPDCPAQYAVTLKGLDPNKLGRAQTIGGVRTGYTHLTGIWSGRTIEVKKQTAPPVPSTTSPELPPDQIPCPAPAGGWRPGQNDIDKIAVVKFLETRQDQATDPRLLYPNGHTPGAPEVYTIGVAHGDLAAFRRAFEQVYDGNLCVHQVRFSSAELNQMATVVSDLIPKGLGVYGAGPSPDDTVGVMALVYDESLKSALTPIGVQNLDLEVAVKPVR